jgi:hypothetical protein
MRSILALALLCAATMKASAQYPNGYFVDGNALIAWCEPHNGHRAEQSVVHRICCWGF